MTLRILAPLLALAVLAPLLRAQNDSPVFIVKNDPVPSPAAPGSTAPRLVNAPDGAVYLSWLEPAPDNHTALRFARFESGTRTWGAARTIGESFAPGLAPRLAVASPQTVGALWHPAANLAVLSTSSDGGANWSAPLVLNRPARLAADAALQSLPDGQFLAAWIEPDVKSGALLARTTAGKNAPASAPFVIDASVSPGCAPALVAFPDGSALVAYRGLAADGVTDIRTARFHDGRWDGPATLSVDDWKPGAPSREGPALAARGIHVGAAWFTAAEGARVNVSVSDDAGAQWLLSNRVDDVAPLGRPDLVLFDDGSQFVSWVESARDDEVILLRRISARGTLSVPVQVGRTTDGAVPCLARVKEGDATPAQVLIAYMAASKAGPSAPDSSISTALFTLPDAAKLTEVDPCGCDWRADDMRGYPVKGRVLSLDAAGGTVELDHDPILGVMKAGTTTVQAAPEVLSTLQPGNTILARLERKGADWTLFTVRVLVTPAAASR